MVGEEKTAVASHIQPREWWDPRGIYQWPVPLLSFGTSIWSSFRCAKVAFGVDPKTKIIPIAIAAVASSGFTVAFWRYQFMRDRELEWGTWKSCPGCEKSHVAAAGVVVGGLIPGLLGGLAVSRAPVDRVWGKRAIGRRHNRVGKVLNTFALEQRGCGMATITGVVALVLFSSYLAHDELLWKRRRALAKWKKLQKEQQEQKTSS